MTTHSRGQTLAGTLTQRLAQPATVIVGLTGIFHLVRGATVDGVVFVVAAAAMAVDAGTGCRMHLPVRLGRLPRWFTRSVAVVAAVALAIAARWGVLAHLVVCCAGAVALAWAWDRPDDPVAGVASWRKHGEGAWWAVIAVGLCLWELTTYILQQITGDDFAHPAMSDLLDPLVDLHLGRGVFVFAWLLGGAALLRLGTLSTTEATGHGEAS